MPSTKTVFRTAEQKRLKSIRERAVTARNKKIKDAADKEQAETLLSLSLFFMKRQQ